MCACSEADDLRHVYTSLPQPPEATGRRTGLGVAASGRAPGSRVLCDPGGPTGSELGVQASGFKVQGLNLGLRV